MQERERRVVSSFDRDVPGSRRLTVNPFTAPAGKISGLKGARTRQQTVYFPVLSLFYFKCYAFLKKLLFIRLCEKEKAKA